jgi:hypothetical protein
MAAPVLVPEVIPEKGTEVAGTEVVQERVPEPFVWRKPEAVWLPGQV